MKALDPCRPGRGWGRKSITTFDRVQAKLQREWELRWGRSFPTVENPLPKSGIDWIDSASGEFVARGRPGKKGFAAAPLTVGTTLFVLTRKGKLIAYRAGAAL